MDTCKPREIRAITPKHHHKTSDPNWGPIFYKCATPSVAHVATSPFCVHVGHILGVQNLK